ncbi:GYD domain-containing protein [Halocatena pleomorpha]|uniref:GYD domain-containing protein n=1 Tax=Halocatena pleomorpha TaxID=1785090 RepID=A0A3P3RJY3_9EURY|nr:GYD domain-containing protein [Halocatena pleomorpha]RRJ33129.1 GYD domain-containing protein [Halocatena pleomorpha]
MGVYMSLVTVNEARIQNVQSLATVWGDLRTEINDHGGHLLESYAILGEYDFLVLFEADDRNQAFRISLIIERRGLDMQTMEIVPTDEFGQLVEDI